MDQYLAARRLETKVANNASQQRSRWIADPDLVMLSAVEGMVCQLMRNAAIRRLAVAMRQPQNIASEASGLEEAAGGQMAIGTGRADAADFGMVSLPVNASRSSYCPWRWRKLPPRLA